MVLYRPFSNKTYGTNSLLFAVSFLILFVEEFIAGINGNHDTPTIIMLLLQVIPVCGAILGLYGIFVDGEENNGKIRALVGTLVNFYIADLFIGSIYY